MSDREVPLPLIRTGLRDKPPRGLSHPVGAEAISRALAGCPQYEVLWTAFGSKPLPLHPIPAEAADFRLAFTVVSNDPNTWYLSVPAVPSKERAVVHQLLVAVGLPAVRDWLCHPRTATWHEGFRTFQVGYALEPLRISLVESLNRRVIASSITAVEMPKAEPFDGR